MDSARWERIQSLFHEAVEIPTAEQRAFLETAAGGDAELIAEIVAMLRADARGAPLLDQGLPEVVNQVLGMSAESVFSREFGQYRLKEILGEGGMGVVWLAERQDAGNLVAIKFLPHAGLSPARRERFTQEIKTLAKLKHPYIARLYDAGTLANGTPWFVMEYVKGVRFTDYCREQALDVKNRLRLFRSVCEAVQYAHGQEIIHRDLKPSNILVDEDGAPRLLDFGIAREMHGLDDPSSHTRPGLRFLSPDYAAPEWVREGSVGFYTDVYSLGVVLYELLAGQLPFERSRITTTRAGNSTLDDPEAPSMVSGRSTGLSRAPAGASELTRSDWNDLDVLCLKAMHRDPQQRYKSVEALIRDLDHYLRHEPLEARPDTLRYRISKFVARNRAAVLATSLLLTFIVGLVVFFTVRLAKSRDTALAEAVRTQRIQRFMLNLFQGEDKDAGPAEDLRVVTMIDRGVPEAQALNGEPEVQADLYQTLGTMYQKLGKLDRADTLLQLSLKQRKSRAVTNDAAIADNLIAIGLLRADQGQSEEAERVVHEAVALVNKRDPQNKPLVAKAYYALGYVLVEAGKFGQAPEVLDRAIALQSAPGMPSPELSQTLTKLADTHIYLGHYSVADSLSQRALAIDRQVYGALDPHVSDDLVNLGQVQELWGHYSDAERCYRQSVQIARSWYGADHPDTAKKMAHLAGTLIYEGQYQEADDLLRSALPTVQRVYGELSPHVAYVLNLQGSIASKREDFKNAETDFRRTIEIYRDTYGDSDYRVAVAMSNLAGVYFKEKRYVQAEQIFRDVVLRFTKSFPADNINTAIAQIKLGRTLLSERRYREAEEQTRAGYETLLRQASPSTNFIEGARQDLVTIYEALNQPQEAQKFRNEPTVADTRSPKLAGPN